MTPGKDTCEKFELVMAALRYVIAGTGETVQDRGGGRWLQSAAMAAATALAMVTTMTMMTDPLLEGRWHTG